ncbi:Haloacid dehalogenase-like hydrolase family protein [Halorhabdus tiamatea SARL4B]|uniref:HAD-superfamily hydrolase, subfamily IA, variant 1 n=1 Tax=Halorhabdus tiamatea SARL4B TaxID=1033806 RepID=F7PK65_9EURY|nr:HAD family hydrolase [Halorhabdus tiamatea]ERJ07598.1 Haloacid dehalogenase-like hydrolase family protein [Halorhabdus tiamatea SARL4B]CCQ33452.1 HAD-superfamily hydrolase, subfamily IA, variant 1 [Halorhabdus tiamatea SARL4B]
MSTAIYFDLDGTLLTLEVPYDDIVEGVLSEYVADPAAATERFLATFGERFDALDPEPYRAGMAAVCEHEDIEADADPDVLVDALREAECERTQVSDDARASLDALGAENELGVLTDGVAAFQRAKLEHHDLLDYFETVIASYDVGAHKPDAAMFERAREAIDAEEYVMVGDSDKDIDGARAAGFVPVRVERGEDVPDFWTTLRALA